LSPAELKPHRLAIRRFLYRFAKRIHTVSRGQKDELVDLGFPAQRIEAVINGVDTMRFRPAQDRATARSAFDIPESATVIGMVGRFGEFKRHDALISAFEQAALQHPNAYLLLPGAGGPKEKATRERVASSEFRSRMMLPGFLQDPRPAYQAMDLLVVPSVNEGLSNAALEAMASGVPVLAHRSCGAAELLGDGLGGWVHDLSSTRQISEGLLNLLESPDRTQEQANLARQRIEERYSIQAMITHYHRLYGELVD
jgi:glycosyltransferase involved in cell wall biosynthesis